MRRSRAGTLLLAAALAMAAACHHRRKGLPGEVAIDEFAWTKARVETRALPDARAPITAHFASGARVPLRAKVVRDGVEWVEIRDTGRPGGWLRRAEVSAARVRPAPSVKAPLARARRNLRAPASGTATAEMIDARALDAERASPPEATPDGARRAPRRPEDDFAMLQAEVDNLYEDPTTWRPSPERRRKDAADFRKGIE